MAADNRTWGAEHIRGELLKLGIPVSKRTVQKYMNRQNGPSSSGQTWATFLKNHAPHLWACDFTQVYDILFRSLFVFVIIEHASRRIVHVAVTAHPSDTWVAQQLREATPWGEGPKYLGRGNDSKFGQHFSNVAAGTGIKEIRTPREAPNANAICERCPAASGFGAIHSHATSRSTENRKGDYFPCSGWLQLDFGSETV